MARPKKKKSEVKTLSSIRLNENQRMVLRELAPTTQSAIDCLIEYYVIGEGLSGKEFGQEFIEEIWGQYE